MFCEYLLDWFELSKRSIFVIGRRRKWTENMEKNRLERVTAVHAVWFLGANWSFSTIVGRVWYFLKPQERFMEFIQINNIEWINMLLSTFIIQYYSKVVLIIAHYLNKIIIIYMCVQFIIATFYDELITDKVL